jgi:formamidopyrimidine-DNA glycosylase
MPELPEVETIRRGLAPHVEGRVLRRLEVLDARWCRPLAPAEIAAATEERRVRRLGRRGKYLVFELSDDVFLTLHLRMTGTLLLDAAPDTPHARVVFDLGEHALRFVDPRRFGTGELQLGPEQRDAFFAARLGLEPFDPAFTGAHLRGLARGRRAPVKAFLLDQTKIAGVGNIYADEALFRARLHPLRPVGTLNRAQLDALAAAVVASLRAGIDAKGATIDDFRDPYGVQGSFQDQFLVHLREGLPCTECGTAVVKLRAAGRGTYVCPRCQRAPRASATRRPPLRTR